MRRNRHSDDLPRNGRVARLLQSAASPTDPVDPPETLLTAMVAAVSADTTNRRKPVLSKVRSIKFGVAALGAVVLTGGTAAAATGSLPDAAQDKVAEVASHVGIDLPDSASDTAKAVHDAQEQAEEDGVTGKERGQMISDAAHDANEARKAAHDAEKGKDDADDEDDDTNGKSADAHERNDERKADTEDADDEADDDADDADDDAVDPADKAADPAQPHLEDAPGQNR